MATRSEIYIRCLRGKDVIELYKHHDGHPEHMIPYLTRFAKWAKRMVKDQLHWLLYPEDVASLLIAYDFVNVKKFHKKFYGKEYRIKANIRPDIRPRGNISDLIRYVYVLDVCEYSKQLVANENMELRTIWSVKWRLKAYEVTTIGESLSDNVRKAIREGVEDNVNELKLVKAKSIKIEGRQSPIFIEPSL
jgi:hypothetical protein